MSAQLTLCLNPPRQASKSTRAKFEDFHARNPWVYEEIRKLAFMMLRRGRKRWAMQGIFQVLRWHKALETNDVDLFKLNDHYSPFYSRLLMENEPELKGFFECRIAIADADTREDLWY